MFVDKFCQSAPKGGRGGQIEGINAETILLLCKSLSLMLPYHIIDPNFDKPVFEYQRVVPVVTYIVNQNIRFSTNYEKNITADRKDSKGALVDLVDKIYLNIRVMF